MKPWDPSGKALLIVSHLTRLRYTEAVVEAHSEVRKMPVDTGLQKVVTKSLKVNPNTRIREYTDYFGSHVQYFNLLEPHTLVEILASSVVETTDAICCGPQASGQHRAGTEFRCEYQNWSPAVPRLREYEEVPNPVSTRLDEEDFIAALRELGSTFKTLFRYDQEATDVHSSQKVLFQKGGGVCQDLAHAMLGVLRTNRVPCRYVSGYLYDPQDGSAGSGLQGTSASHAWVQVWHDELGWVGIDPTNDKLVDWQYVRIATGRDYTDVQPLRGVFLGAPEQHLEVEVDVQRIG